MNQKPRPTLSYEWDTERGKTTLAHVGGVLPRDGAKPIHCLINHARGFARGHKVRLTSGDSGICRLLAVGRDYQREGVEHRGIGTGVFGECEGFGRRSAESLVEMEREIEMTRGVK